MSDRELRIDAENARQFLDDLADVATVVWDQVKDDPLQTPRLEIALRLLKFY